MFSRDKKCLREFLLKNTELQYIARLGEGFFPNVARGSVLIIAKKKSSTNYSMIECIRIFPKIRKLIQNQKLSLIDADQLYAKFISQDRFSKNPGFIFDIDISKDEEKLISKLSNKKSIMSDYLNSYRGVELSKKGIVIQCGYCNKWMPAPKKKLCQNCGTELDFSKPKKIVRNTPFPGHLPFIVGENISRYEIFSNLYIDVTKEGIRYKDINEYSSPKIVIRKTGVGIMTSIDYSGALTNQVVYILIKNKYMSMNICWNFFVHC